MKLDPNAPAYPVECDYSNGVPRGRQTDLRSGCETGLTVRQEFAKAAMQGFCANPAVDTWDSAKTARVSAEYADALIDELNKETK